MEKNIYILIYIYIYVTSPYRRNEHNIVNQLHFNKKFFKDAGNNKNKFKKTNELEGKSFFKQQ